MNTGKYWTNDDVVAGYGLSMKGTGFSPYIEIARSRPALAAEGMGPEEPRYAWKNSINHDLLAPDGN